MKYKKKKKKKMMIIKSEYNTLREIEVNKIEELLRDKTLKNWSKVVLKEYLYSLKHNAK